MRKPIPWRRTKASFAGYGAEGRRAPPGGGKRLEAGCLFLLQEHPENPVPLLEDDPPGLVAFLRDNQGQGIQAVVLELPQRDPHGRHPDLLRPELHRGPRGIRDHLHPARDHVPAASEQNRDDEGGGGPTGGFAHPWCLLFPGYRASRSRSIYANPLLLTSLPRERRGPPA